MGPMPGLRDLLSRFRAASAPGAPSAVGVPADRRADAAAELEPVFAALAGAEAGCSRLRTAGDAIAQHRIDQANARAATLIAQASAAVPAERASAMAEGLRDHESARLAEDARGEASAAEAARAADTRIPGLLDQVVESVRRDIARLAAEGGTTP